mgnify:CR=1 FL=1
MLEYDRLKGFFRGRILLFHSIVCYNTLDSQGTISATLTSEYRSGLSLPRTRYSLGPYPDYIQTSSQVIMDWRYIAATNEILFEGIGYLDLGELNQEGWKVNPVVSVCLGADVIPY